MSVSLRPVCWHPACPHAPPQAGMCACPLLLTRTWSNHCRVAPTGGFERVWDTVQCGCGCRRARHSSAHSASSDVMALMGTSCSAHESQQHQDVLGFGAGDMRLAFTGHVQRRAARCSLMAGPAPHTSCLDHRRVRAWHSRRPSQGPSDGCCARLERQTAHLCRSCGSTPASSPPGTLVSVLHSHRGTPHARSVPSRNRARVRPPAPHPAGATSPNP